MFWLVCFLSTSCHLIVQTQFFPDPWTHLKQKNSPIIIICTPRSYEESDLQQDEDDDYDDAKVTFRTQYSAIFINQDLLLNIIADIG